MIMQRESFVESGAFVRQNHKTGMFNANDIDKSYNKIRISKNLPMRQLSEYKVLVETANLIDAICEDEGITKDLVISSKSGKNGGTYMHPLLFIDYCMWVSTEFKLKVLKWVRDELIQFRDSSGDSYKEMCALLYAQFPDDFKADRPRALKKLGSTIAECCGVSHLQADRWQKATKVQLKKRDILHSAVITACDFAKIHDNSLSETLGSAKLIAKREWDRWHARNPNIDLDN